MRSLDLECFVVGLNLRLCVCVCKVTSPHGSSYHFGDHVDSGNYAFTASEAGDYSACFWIPEGKTAPAVVTIEFEWRTGVAAKDWSKVAKKGQIEVSNIYMFLDLASVCINVISNLLSL